MVDAGTGFSWRSRRSETLLEDSDVTAIRLTNVPQLSAGAVVVSIFRCVEVWVNAGPQPLCMCNQIDTGDTSF